MRRQEQQIKWVASTAIFALIFGLLASQLAWGVLPLGWREQVASIFLSSDRWDAGWALPGDVNPDARENAAAGLDIVESNHDRLAACFNAAAQSRTDQACMIIIKSK